MKVVLLYSHADEPVTRALLSSELDQKCDIIKISLEALIKDSVIIDEFDETEIKVEWQFPSGIKITNTEDVYLINRILSIPEYLFADFSEEDRAYSISEFRAYLAFAIEAFPRCISRPGAFGLAGNRFSLPRQWEIIQQSNLFIKTPNYYLGNMNFCPLNERVIYSEPFNFYCWKSRPEARNASSFAFEKPEGKPIITCVMGDKVEVFPYCSQDQISLKEQEIIKTKGKILSNLFDYQISECLFFLDELHVSFGMISNIPYASRLKKWFSHMLDSFLITTMGRDGRDYT